MCFTCKHASSVTTKLSITLSLPISFSNDLDSCVWNNFLPTVSTLNQSKSASYFMLYFCIRFWLHFPLDLLCSWFTWPPSQSLVLVSTLLGVLELLLSTTKISHGMTMWVLLQYCFYYYFSISKVTNKV